MVNSSVESSAGPTPGALRAISGRERVIGAIAATGLCLITDDRLADQPLLDATHAALAAGVRLVQFRNKHATRRQYLEQARCLQELCANYDAAFLVNDHPDIARVLNADGVHVGQDDLPARLTRDIVGSAMAVGLSISYVNEAEEAARESIVDYIGCGAVYPTSTKSDAEFGGLELLRAVRSILRVPILAIGGITAQNLSESIHAGADGVALVSAVYGSSDPGAAARQVLERIGEARATAG